jgi:hypothetical protein
VVELDASELVEETDDDEEDDTEAPASDDEILDGATGVRGRGRRGGRPARS